MFDIRKILIVLLIAVLFSIFVFSTVEAFYPSPQYDDFCDNQARPGPVGQGQDCPAINVSEDDRSSCEGHIEYRYGSDGCPSEYYCETCNLEYEDAQDAHDQVVFYIAAIFSLVAIFAGLYLPSKKESVHEWVGTGFLLAGVFILLFGTIQGFESLHRFAKPLVMLAELLLVVFLAYKKLS